MALCSFAVRCPGSMRFIGLDLTRSNDVRMHPCSGRYGEDYRIFNMPFVSLILTCRFIILPQARTEWGYMSEQPCRQVSAGSASFICLGRYM